MTESEFLDALLYTERAPHCARLTAVAIESDPGAPLRMAGRMEGGRVFLLSFGEDGAAMHVGPTRLAAELRPDQALFAPARAGMTIERDAVELAELIGGLLVIAGP